MPEFPITLNPRGGWELLKYTTPIKIFVKGQKGRDGNKSDLLICVDVGEVPSYTMWLVKLKGSSSCTSPDQLFNNQILYFGGFLC